jgi:hypothetical protein
VSAIDIGKGVKVTAVLLVGPRHLDCFFRTQSASSAPFMALFARPDFTAAVERARSSQIDGCADFYGGALLI